MHTCNRQLSCKWALFVEHSCPTGIACPTHRGEPALPASRALSGLGLLLSTTPAIRQLAVLSEACASCSLRAVIVLTRPSTLPVRPPKAYSFVSYPCAITGMHACSCDNAHACTRRDGPAYSTRRRGANLPWLSGRCLAVTPVSCLQPTLLAVASASSSCSLHFVVALTR